MTRRPRHDEPGSWHHVGNRAVARVQRDYVRRFNRLRHRDGSLVRGRYWSRVIESYGYMMAVIRYIDANAVQANLASRGSEWRYGSARCFAGRDRTPRWLSRALIERQVRHSMGTEVYDPAHYDVVFQARHTDDFIVSRARTIGIGEARIDDLIASAPGAVLDWMRQKTALADGTRPGTALASPEAIRRTVAEHRRSVGWFAVACNGRKHDGWTELEVGLLRDLSGIVYSETGKIVSLTTRRVRAAYERHHTLLATDAVYAERVADVVRQVIEPLVRGVPAEKMSAAFQVPYGRYWRVSSTEFERRMTVAAL